MLEIIGFKMNNTDDKENITTKGRGGGWVFDNCVESS